MGFTAKIEEIMIGEDKLIKFSGCKKGEACSIVLRGSSSYLLDEAERSLHDALCVLLRTIEDKMIIYGGGNSELRMAIAVEELAKNEKGKEALAIEAFAEALKQLPIIIADNGGYDANELVQNIMYEIRHGAENSGINMNDGTVGDMEKLGVYGSLRVKE